MCLHRKRSNAFQYPNDRQHFAHATMKQTTFDLYSTDTHTHRVTFILLFYSIFKGWCGAIASSLLKYNGTNNKTISRWQIGRIKNNRMDWFTRSGHQQSGHTCAKEYPKWNGSGRWIVETCIQIVESNIHSHPTTGHVQVTTNHSSQYGCVGRKHNQRTGQNIDRCWGWCVTWIA